MSAQCNFGRTWASCIGRDPGVVRRAVEETLSGQATMSTKHHRQGTIAKAAALKRRGDTSDTKSIPQRHWRETFAV